MRIAVDKGRILMMKSEETKKQIDDLKEVLQKQKTMEQADDFASKMAYIVRRLYMRFMDEGFHHDEALELTKIWCVRNFGQK